MPSFFNKVLRRKRDEKDGTSPQQASGNDLLGGRFEDVSPTVSPSMNNFPELKGSGDVRGRNREKTTHKDHALRTFFRSKSRARSPARQGRTKVEEAPKLDLNLLTEDKGLDEPEPVFSEATIGTHRLTPVEALGLIQTCSQVISARGLDTLGIMHPHWYSASPDVQRTLISLFIHSLTAKSPLSTSTFDNEINSTRSPHDVAAVLRWGLRHLSLEADPEWYSAFFDAERKADYPPKAFSDILTPLVPGPHYELLKNVLDLFSSLATRAESNSTSGSKLSKVFGLWLLNSHRVETQDDWRSFYTRWETAGRQLEHLFFAHIRNEDQIPRRLAELVQKYPYYQPSPTTDLQLLPRPKFTTRLYDALFIRVETELPNASLRPTRKVHPLRVVAEALSSTGDEGQLASLWAKVVEASKAEGSGSPLTRIFADETIRFLTMLPDDQDAADTIHSPIVALLPPSPGGRGKRRSFSLSEFTSEGIKRSHSGQTQSPEAETPLSASSTDWSVFSSAGFSATTPLTPLASTLFSTDVERTSPGAQSKRTSRYGRSPSITSVPRKSVDFAPEVRKASGSSSTPPKDETIQLISKIASFQIVHMDEAFVDFWSDALLDPIASTWPSFVICKIRPSLSATLTYTVNASGEEQTQKLLEWVVLEQVFTVKPPPVHVPSPEATEAQNRAATQGVERPSSPSSLNKKRFAFWSSSRSNSVSSVLSLSRNKKEKEVRVGEMGELIEEGEEGAATSRTSSSANRRKEKKEKDVVRVRVPSPKPRKSTEIPRKSIDAGVAASKVTRVPVPAVDTAVEETKVAEKSEESKAPAAAAVGVAAASIVVGTIASAEAAQKEEDVPVTQEPPAESQADGVPPTPAVDAKQEKAPAPVVDELKNESVPIPTVEETPKEDVASQSGTQDADQILKEVAPAPVTESAEESCKESTPVEIVEEKAVMAPATEEEAIPIPAPEITTGIAVDEAEVPVTPAPVAESPTIAVEEGVKHDIIPSQATEIEETKEQDVATPDVDVIPKQNNADVEPHSVVDEALGAAEEDVKSPEPVAATETAQELRDPDPVAPTPATVASVDSTPEEIAEKGAPLPTEVEAEAAPATTPLVEAEEAIASAVQDIEPTPAIDAIPIAVPTESALVESIAEATVVDAPLAAEEPADVKDIPPASTSTSTEEPQSEDQASPEPQESAEDALIRETIETSEARHAGDAVDALAQTAVDAKPDQEEEDLSPAIPPGLESVVASTAFMSAIDEASEAGLGGSATHDKPAPVVEEAATVIDEPAPAADQVAPFSAITPSSSATPTVEGMPADLNDSFIEVVHTITNVDKIIPPPEIVEAAHGLPLDRDESSPQVEIIHQIVEVDKVHTPPAIVEAAQEQGGTPPSSEASTPSVVEMTQAESQPVLSSDSASQPAPEAPISVAADVDAPTDTSVVETSAEVEPTKVASDVDEPPPAPEGAKTEEVEVSIEPLKALEPPSADPGVVPSQDNGAEEIVDQDANANANDDDDDVQGQANVNAADATDEPATATEIAVEEEAKKNDEVAPEPVPEAVVPAAEPEPPATVDEPRTLSTPPEVEPEQLKAETESEPLVAKEDTIVEPNEEVGAKEEVAVEDGLAAREIPIQDIEEVAPARDTDAHEEGVTQAVEEDLKDQVPVLVVEDEVNEEAAPEGIVEAADDVAKEGTSPVEDRPLEIKEEVVPHPVGEPVDAVAVEDEKAAATPDLEEGVTVPTAAESIEPKEEEKDEESPLAQPAVSAEDNTDNVVVGQEDVVPIPVVEPVKDEAVSPISEPIAAPALAADPVKEAEEVPAPVAEASARDEKAEVELPLVEDSMKEVVNVVEQEGGIAPTPAIEEASKEDTGSSPIADAIDEAPRDANSSVPVSEEVAKEESTPIAVSEEVKEDTVPTPAVEIVEEKEEAAAPTANETPEVVEERAELPVNPTVNEQHNVLSEDAAAPNEAPINVEVVPVPFTIESASEDMNATAETYTQVTDVEVDPKPPVDNAIVVEEVPTSQDGVTEVEQSAGVSLIVESEAVVEATLATSSTPAEATPSPSTELKDIPPEEPAALVLPADATVQGLEAQAQDQSPAVDSTNDVIQSIPTSDVSLSSTVDHTTSVTDNSASAEAESTPPEPSMPTVQVIASATPRIAPLNLGEDGPGDAGVDLKPVPVVDVPVLPPSSSASAAFPDLLRPMYETVPVDVLSPREELSTFAFSEEEGKSRPNTSDSAQSDESQHELASSLASVAATSDLPSAIEQIVQAGLTPSAEALLDAVQESLIGAMREDGASPVPMSPPPGSDHDEAITPAQISDLGSAHAPEASVASISTLVNPEETHSRSETLHEERSVPTKAAAPSAVEKDSAADATEILEAAAPALENGQEHEKKLDVALDDSPTSANVDA